MDRRSFLKTFLALSLGSSFAGYKIFEFFEERERKLKTVKRTKPMMGTFVTVLVADQSRDRAEEAISSFFQEAERLVRIFDWHDKESVLSFLNRYGIIRDFPPELYEVLNLSSLINIQTCGYFDVTVKPILDLFRSRLEKKEVPEENEISSVLKKVGMEKISLKKKEIRFLEEGVEVTLDGIAKGYIAEKASDKLRKFGIRSALIDAGGDILLIGDYGGRRWKIGIRDPNSRDRVLKVFNLRDCAIATSGSYERYFDPEGKYHHLIDPKLGLSPTEFQSMSVIHRSLTIADSLSTSFFVAPESIRRELLMKLGDVRIYGVGKQKEVST